MEQRKFIPQMEPWHGEEEKRAVNEYLDSGGWLMDFKRTREFEKAICDYTGAKYCCVLPNGTLTLFVALNALGIGKGDEVIVPDYTMIASPNAVKLAGAEPVFVDIDPETLCMDVNLVKKAITPRTKAIMHVSINGRAGDLDKLVALCKEKNIPLVEDAAQSLGSFYKGKHLGTYGIVGSFSFSVPKIITTGQGGALITDDEALYGKIRKIKDFGRVGDGLDVHDMMGWNFKFTDVQAVIGIEQMKKLPWRVERKKEIYSLYNKLLKGVKQVKFIGTDLEAVSPWFIDVLVEDRENLVKFLKENGIGSRPFYPPIHVQKIYSYVSGKYPNTEAICQKGLWLPSASKLSDDEIIFICKKISEFYGHR
ncbi:MAG: DegT/DnrJ/EryC1/StrS family aminotransferase [Candidatus Micrarchaeia archaeon]